MKYLQKLGKALMLPVACLPICGILMGIGYLLCLQVCRVVISPDLVRWLVIFLVKSRWCSDR